MRTIGTVALAMLWGLVWGVSVVILFNFKVTTPALAILAAGSAVIGYIVTCYRGEA